MALVPLLCLAVVLGRGKVPKLNYVLLTASFFMSWIGDSITSFIDGEVAYQYLWAPAQIILAYAAVMEVWWSMKRVILIGSICALVITVSLLNVDPGSLLWPLGGIGLVFFARHGSVEVPVFIYFGLGTVAYIFMINEVDEARLMRFWLTYQGCRLVALSSLCILISKESNHVVYD